MPTDISAVIARNAREEARSEINVPDIRIARRLLTRNVMEMHQVRYFLALCEERNFTRAARRCGVAQPSLTRAIKQMEEKLGGSLFDRNRTNTRLTDLGILLRPDLAQIDRSAADAKRKAAKFIAARSITRPPPAMEASMRIHHAIAVVGFLVIGLGAKLFFFSAPTAEANIPAVKSSGMNVNQMHVDHRNNLPVQKMHDMSFVFSEAD